MHSIEYSPFLRLTLRAGWLNHVLTRNCHFFLKCWLGTTLLCFTIFVERLSCVQVRCWVGCCRAARQESRRSRHKHRLQNAETTPACFTFCPSGWPH